MKLAKKLISLSLSIMIVAVLGVAVLAAGTGSITIENPQPGKTYTAYKIFDVTYSGEEAYSYTISKSDPNLLIVQQYAGSTGSGLTLTSAGTVFNVSFSKGTDAFSAPKFAAFLKEKTLFGGIDFSSVGGKMKVDGIREGYYFINSSSGTLCELATAKDITIHDKNVAPKISKTHDDADSTVYVGQKVNFTITGAIPATVGYNKYTYEITDKMTSGLVLNRDINVKIDGVDVSESASVEIQYDADNKGFFVGIVVSQYADKIGKDVVITYSATVNENAIERGKETNTVTLKYSNDPNNDESFGTASDTANLYSFNVKVDKHDANNTAKKLVGAEFYFKNSSDQYYKRDGITKNVTWVDNKEEATKLSSDTNGTLTFTGINMGTYYLEEVKAPDGYNLLSSDVAVVMNKNAANNGYNITVGGNAATVESNLTVIASIANSTGTMLPETGGTGTIIFIVVGAVAVIGAGLFLVTNKRMSKEGI